MGTTGAWTGYGHLGWAQARGYTAQARDLQSRCNVPIKRTYRDPFTKADVEGRRKKGIWVDRPRVPRAVAPKEREVTPKKHLATATTATGKTVTEQVRKPLTAGDLMRRFPGLSLAEARQRAGL